MIEINKKVYRNIEEQVAKNASDIAKYADIEETVTSLKEECIDLRNECVEEKNEAKGYKESCDDTKTYLDTNYASLNIRVTNNSKNLKYYKHSITVENNVGHYIRFVIIDNSPNDIGVNVFFLTNFYESIVNCMFYVNTNTDPHTFYNLVEVGKDGNNLYITYIDNGTPQEAIWNKNSDGIDITDVVYPLFLNE